MKKLYILAVSAIMALATYAASPKFTRLGAEIPAPVCATAPAEFSIDGSKLKFIGHVPAQLPRVSVKAQTSLLAESDWQTLEGECSYTDDTFTTFFGTSGLTPRTWNITIQKHATRNIYRIADPYAGDNFFTGYHTADANRYLYLNAEDPDKVFFCNEAGNPVPYFGTGIDIGYGEGRISTAANIYLAAGETPKDNMYAKLKYGAFEFPEGVLGVGFANYQGGNFAQANLNGKMRIALPDAKDYRCDISFGRFAVRGEKCYISLEIGEDVATSKLAMFVNEPWISQSTFEWLMSQPGKAEEVSFGTYEISIDGAQGRTSANLVLMCYDENGNVVGCDYTELVIDVDNNPDWVTLEGEGMYCDGVYSDIYNGVMMQNIPVTVQQHKDYPGYFRIVNPYTSGAWSAAAGLNPVLDSEMDHYIYIDATIPDKVFIEDSALGVNFGDGEGMLSSIAFVMACYEQDATGYYGTLDAASGLITFPAESLTFSEKAYSNGARYPVSNANTQLQLPESWAAISTVEADNSANTPAEYYNLQGIRVYNVDNAPGIYIRRQGDKTNKVIIK